MYIGITHLGIVTFQGNKRTHQFKWYDLLALIVTKWYDLFALTVTALAPFVVSVIACSHSRHGSVRARPKKLISEIPR